ncbi:MAG TPA: GNAT family protein [Symbiobacteriaceae bacterium]|nr:GNAT family protein [Symbiobacteriaceae bacterium]
MSLVAIRLITHADAEALLAFETANRAFFRTMVPDRPDNYYTLEHMHSSIEGALAEIAAGTWYPYLIWDHAGNLVGRINLSEMNGPAASLGYRIGEAYNGKGYATASIRQVLAEAFGRWGLRQVHAVTTVVNIGSQIALLKNGFQFVRRVPQELHVNHVWYDSVHFTKVKSDVHGV